jgi:hypothetical protein
MPKKSGSQNAEDLLILPDAACLISKEEFSEKSGNVLEAKVADVAFKGSIHMLSVEVSGGHVFHFDMFKSAPPAETGDIVYLAVNPEPFLQYFFSYHFRPVCSRDFQNLYKVCTNTRFLRQRRAGFW